MSNRLLENRLEIDLKFLSTTANQLRGIEFILDKHKLIPCPIMMLLAEEAVTRILKPSADWDRHCSASACAQTFGKGSAKTTKGADGESPREVATDAEFNAQQ